MNLCKLTKNNLWGGLARCSSAALTVAGMMLAPTAAHACGNPAGPKSSAALKLSSLMPTSLAAGQADQHNSIVGIWHVTYTAADGTFFYDSLDQWRRDGTEFEIANLSPTEGNVCIGEWKKVNSTIQLNHVGWAFDNVGNPAGMFTLTEKNRVSSDGGSYVGTFDYKAYDLNGDVVLEITGTLAATRITSN